MSEALFRIKSPVIQYTGITLQNPNKITVNKGINAVIGNNGSGKSSFAKILRYGCNFMTNVIEWSTADKPKIVTVEFADIHSLTGSEIKYYQQRYESTMNDDVVTVSDILGDKIDTDAWQTLSVRLGLNDIRDKKINYMSSGELRKLLIIQALIDRPDLLILDNPFIGLDAPSRQIINDALKSIAETGVSVMLLVCDTADIADYVSQIIVIEDKTISCVINNEGEKTIQRLNNLLDDDNDGDAETSVYIPEVGAYDENDEIVAINHCHVKYGSRVIIDDVSWTIRRNEAWALSGPNGSGKSTLLSLINADNPQAYSNDIRLFGHKRGSGSSIWEIKSEIGFMSSEQHLCYDFGFDTVEKMLGDGCRPAIDRYKPLTEEMKRQVDAWIKYFGIEKLRYDKFSALSFGQQRLVLMIRAFLGARQLLILDEPLHGLDRRTKRKALKAIDIIVNSGITLIYVTHNPEEYPTCVTLTKRLR